MQEFLKKKYDALKELCELDTAIPNADLNIVLKGAIQTFLGQCNNPAIWCY